MVSILQRQEARTGVRMVDPFAGAPKFIETDPAGLVVPLGEVREDDREMASAGHHGIGLVRTGLAATTRVDMPVGDHAHAPFPAMPPNPRTGRLAVAPLPGGQSVRVDALVEDDVAEQMSATRTSFDE